LSYDIIYNKQFVRLRKTGEVIPMVLSGSSNCFEIGQGGRNGRRSRDWSSLRYYNRKGKLSEKPEIIVRNLEADLRKIIRRHRKEDKAKPSDIMNRFGWYASLAVNGGSCSDTSWGQWSGVFINGIKSAMTLEELDKLGVNLRFTAYGNDLDGKPAQVPIKTEREYFSELSKWREWQAEHTDKLFSLSFFPLDTDGVLRRLMTVRRKPAAAPREKVQQDHYFILTDGSCALIRYTSRGYRYSYSQTGYNAKRFKSEKDAETYRLQLVAKGRHKADIWTTKRIDQPASF
jgi:hypothetical protein